MPAARVPGFVLHTKNSCRHTRRQRYIEAIQRIAKAITNSFDEGLLARPAIEESLRPLAPIEGEVSLVLTSGKVACRDVVGIGNRADGFDVDANLTATIERVDGDILGVRNVESQTRTRASPRERRLAMRPVLQLDRFRSQRPAARQAIHATARARQ